MAKKLTREIQIEGTHCASCEVLLERRLKKVNGVSSASVDFATGKANITCNSAVSDKSLAQAVNRDGYRLVKEGEQRTTKLAGKDYAQIGALFLLFVALYLVFKRFDLLPSVGVPEGMSLGVVFVIGLIASTSTCLAVTGGLLLALAAKHSESYPQLTGVKKFKPTLYFNIGRVFGYALFGAALGALGSLFTFSPFASGALTVVAAIIMIVLGLQMLHLFPFLERISVRMPKFFAHSLHDKSGSSYRPWAPFVLGAGTFFVPCGFTQALQFYVLAQGNALSGGLTMLVFALGTLPVLLALGAVSSFTRGAAHKHFVRAAAVLVVLLGLLSLPAGLTLLR